MEAVSFCLLLQKLLPLTGRKSAVHTEHLQTKDTSAPVGCAAADCPNAQPQTERLHPKPLALSKKKYYTFAMPDMTDWQDEEFARLYEDELRLLERRRKNDSTCTLDDLKGILDALYINDGNNVSGRSVVKQIGMSASIAAYEKFIFDWERENKQKQTVTQ